MVYQGSYTIVCLDKMDTVASESNIAVLLSLPNFHFVRGDITNKHVVEQVLKEYNVDAIMHFAASSHVQNSFTDAFTFTHNNITGTQVLLEAAKAHGRIKRFLHVSTDEVYGESHGAFADETHRLAPTNPYSASKAAAEMYVNASHKSFGIPVVTVRSNNVYGPCQYPESQSSFPFPLTKLANKTSLHATEIIPTFIRLLMDGQKLTIQGTGANTRCYLYAADAADAFNTIFHRGVVGEVYNVDSADEVANVDVAKRILKHFGLFSGDAGDESWATHVEYVPDRPFNDGEYRVDGQKLAALGWRQTVGFEEGLCATVEWYRENLRRWWL